MGTSQLDEDLWVDHLTDGTPYTMKVVRTVWTGGKIGGLRAKDLPISITLRVIYPHGEVQRKQRNMIE